MSDYTYFIQFQHTLDSKFGGDVKGFLLALNAGEDDTVSVSQLVEYLKVIKDQLRYNIYNATYLCNVNVLSCFPWFIEQKQEIDFPSETEVLRFSDKLSNPDGSVTAPSVTTGIDAFLKSQKDADADDDDFNFTADSLMKQPQNDLDANEDDDFFDQNRELGSEHQYSPSNHSTPPPLSPFPRRSGDDHDNDDEDNLNDVSMLSDDNFDSRPTSPSRAFYQPSPRAFSGKKRRPKPHQEDGDDTPLGDSSDEDENEEQADLLEEDESDNSSIDTAGMKHSQTVDSENFFFCPDPEPNVEPSPQVVQSTTDNATGSLEGQCGNTNQPHVSNDSSTHDNESDERSNDKDFPLSSASVFHPDGTSSPPPSGIDTHQDENSPGDLENKDDVDVDNNVGLSLTALPRQLNAAPHPYEDTPIGGDDTAGSGHEKEEQKTIDNTGIDESDNASETNSATSDITDQSAESSNSRRFTDKSDFKTKDNEQQSHQSKASLGEPKLPSFSHENDSISMIKSQDPSTTCTSSVSVDCFSEVVKDDDIAGLWERHPVRQRMISEKKQRVFAFGRTSYEDQHFRKCSPSKKATGPASITRSVEHLGTTKMSVSSNEKYKSDAKSIDKKKETQAKGSKRVGGSKLLFQQQYEQGSDVFSEPSAVPLAPSKEEVGKTITNQNKRIAMLIRSESKGDSGCDSWSLDRRDSKFSDTDTQNAHGELSVNNLNAGSSEDEVFDNVEDSSQENLPTQKNRFRSSQSYTSREDFSGRRGSSQRISSTGIFKGQYYLEDHVHLLEKRFEVLLLAYGVNLYGILFLIYFDDVFW